MSTIEDAWEWPNKRLKKICDSKGYFASMAYLPVFVFSCTEFVVRVHKHFHHRLQCFKPSRKTSTSPRQNRNIMPQISIDALNCECITLIANIAHMSARIDYVHISHITVGVITLCRRRFVNDGLKPLWRFVKRNVKAYDLSRFTAYRGHNIDIFTGFRFRFALNEPVQLIKF